MTTIFSIPLDNGKGAVLVGDRLITNTSNDGVVPLYISTKIYYINNYLIGYSGDPRQFVKFKNYLEFTSKIDFDALYTLFAQNQISDNKIELEIMIIDSNCNRYVIDISKITSTSDWSDFLCEGRFVIGSGYFQSRNSVLQDICCFTQSQAKFSDKCIVQRCIETLQKIAAEDYKYTGSPHIYGCDILLYRNKICRQYKVIPHFTYKNVNTSKQYKI